MIDPKATLCEKIISIEPEMEQKKSDYWAESRSKKRSYRILWTLQRDLIWLSLNFHRLFFYVRFIVDHSAMLHLWIQVKPEVFQKSGFCAGIASFTKMRIFWRKTKVIFGISSSSYVEWCITITNFRKQMSDPVPVRVPKIDHFVFCKRYKEFKSDWPQIYTDYSSICNLSLALA